MVKSHEKFVKLVVLHRKVSIFMVFGLRSQMKRRILSMRISRMRVLVEGTWTIFASKNKRVKK